MLCVGVRVGVRVGGEGEEGYSRGSIMPGLNKGLVVGGRVWGH